MLVVLEGLLEAQEHVGVFRVLAGGELANWLQYRRTLDLLTHALLTPEVNDEELRRALAGTTGHFPHSDEYVPLPVHFECVAGLSVRSVPLQYLKALPGHGNNYDESAIFVDRF